MIKKMLYTFLLVISSMTVNLFSINPYAPSAPPYEMLNPQIEPSAPINATFKLQFYKNSNLGESVKFHLASPDDRAIAIAHCESLSDFYSYIPTVRDEINNALDVWESYHQNIRVEMHINNNATHVVKIFIAGNLWKAISFDENPKSYVPINMQVREGSLNNTLLKAVSIVAVVGITVWAGKKIFKALK